MNYYIHILNNKLNGCGTCPTDSSIKVSEELYNTFRANQNTYDYQDGKIVNISNTDEYKAKVTETENAMKKVELQAQIDALDLRRIRALAEGGNYSDTQTYLEHYTEQIVNLRTQLSEL